MSSRVRKLRDGTVLAVHRNDGLRKLCRCPRSRWTKGCSHPWHFAFKWKGVHHRFSLDRYLGRNIESKTEAEREAERLRVAIKDGTFFKVPEPAQPAKDSFAVYAHSWLQTATPNLKASTIRFYRDNLENHIFPTLGGLAINEITRKDCRRLITLSREKGLKIQTVRGIVRTLSTVLSQAVDDELLSANPALHMRKHLKRGDEPQYEPDPFTRDEVSHLLAVTAEHFPKLYPLLLCGLRTGMRVGELLALQWGDIDWRGRYIQVRRNLVYGNLTTPKNHQQRRVDMSPVLRRVLRLSRRKQSAKCLADGVPRPAWVFPTILGTPLDDANVRKLFNDALDKAGLHRRGPHQMRHTFGSLLVNAGEPITYVSRQLGHKDSAITLRVYARWLLDPTGRKGVDTLDLAEPVAKTLQRPHRATLKQIA